MDWKAVVAAVAALAALLGLVRQEGVRAGRRQGRQDMREEVLDARNDAVEAEREAYYGSDPSGRFARALRLFLRVRSTGAKG